MVLYSFIPAVCIFIRIALIVKIKTWGIRYSNIPHLKGGSY